MVALPFNAGVGRASLRTATLLIAFLATATSAAPNQQHGADKPLLATRETLEACLASANIEVSTPASATWAKDSESWNSRVNPVPAGVVFPKTEEEVTAALQCAAASNTKVTTLGGNRSFSSMGFGRNDGALVFNLKNMPTSQITYDDTTRVMSYGGPTMISDVAVFLNEKGSTMPHGRCPDVGMTGVAASGFGTLSRKFGTVLDNLVGVRVALANGSIVDSDAQTNPDLLWAVKGAASSMGVVLQFKVNTIEQPSKMVTNYTIAFPKDYNATKEENVLGLVGLQNWALSADNSDMISIRYQLKGLESFAEGFFYGTSEEFDKVSASIMKNMPTTFVLNKNESDFWTAEDASTPGIATKAITPRRFFYIASVTIPTQQPLTVETATLLYDSAVLAPKIDDARTGGFVDVWGGAYTAGVKPGDSAWQHDHNLLLVRWDMRTTSFDVPFADASIDTMRKNFYGFVDGYKAAGGKPKAFTTYRDERWTVDEMAEYLYGDNWSKLQTIKTQYDPTEMFNTDPQAIPASGKPERKC